ncbi:hypothetical protein [Hymenobacter chitinivorans]|uniref:Uncharacterized protein n=1 Tax=Hymenobacter chitinivorans DSM 11115 TaxID=1121954 RepID=A0A2M9BR54_9BACT|nr:hypothetical protein [Hymenobacter chitinivorans]PJJ60429.1 hypothetical protein CLV45_1855 [Hymenobacter chitinivorans DSM 11115]
MPDKQSRELFLLEKFLPTLFAETPFSLSQPKPPLPDFIIQVEGKKIGIEMTALILNEESREREAKQDAILDEAQRLFEARSHLPLQVTVGFSEAVDWSALNRKPIAAFLAGIIESSVLAVKDLPQNQAQFDIRIESFIHSHIHSVGIFYLDRLTTPCWSPITSFWVPDAPVAKIQEIITRKSNNISGYLTGCDEVWLLILETGSPSSYFDRFEKLQDTIFESGFARTVIGRISKGDLIEL